VQLPQGSQYAEWLWDDVVIGAFGARGVWLDNAAGNRDGFFNGATRASHFENGILGTNLGDSVAFEDVVVHGRNNVDVSCVPGARFLSFVRGQITTEAGFLMLRGCDGARVRDTWMEHPGGAVPIDSMVYVENSADVTFDGLALNVGNALPAQVFGSTARATRGSRAATSCSAARPPRSTARPRPCGPPSPATPTARRSR
jgi:hypothetical protein